MPEIDQNKSRMWRDMDGHKMHARLTAIAKTKRVGNTRAESRTRHRLTKQNDSKKQTDFFYNEDSVKNVREMDGRTG